MSTAANLSRAALVSKLKSRLELASMRIAVATARRLEADQELETQQARFDRALEQLVDLALTESIPG